MFGSMWIGNAMARLQRAALPAWRQREQIATKTAPELVQISME